MIIIMLNSFIISGCTITISDNEIDIKGWQSFEEGIVNEYDFVKGMHVTNVTPIASQFVILVERELTFDEMVPIFEKVLEYIKEDEVMDGIREIHNQRSRGSDLSSFTIKFHKYSEFDCRFTATVSMDNSFTYWGITLNGESVGTYEKLFK